MPSSFTRVGLWYTYVRILAVINDRVGLCYTYVRILAVIIDKSWAMLSLC